MPKKSTIYDFREELWNLLFKRAEGLDGRAVAEAFREGSRDVWNAGIDKAWEKLKQPTTSGAKQAFDIAWIAATSQRLKKLKEKASNTRTKK